MWPAQEPASYPPAEPLTPRKDLADQPSCGLPATPGGCSQGSERVCDSPTSHSHTAQQGSASDSGELMPPSVLFLALIQPKLVGSSPREGDEVRGRPTSLFCLRGLTSFWAGGSLGPSIVRSTGSAQKYAGARHGYRRNCPAPLLCPDPISSGK